MLHHVGIELRADDVDRAVEFFELLGFAEVAAPPSLADRFDWLEHDGTQIHLMLDDAPRVPPRGHLAVAVGDFDATLVRLRRAGFGVELRREHWGVPRALAVAPGGHKVEVIAATP